MNSADIFLVAMTIIFAVPYLIWRLARTDYYAPLVVVQIITGILLGPGILGAAYPRIYATVFSAPVIAALNGIAWWAVMLFVWIAGIELDLKQVWVQRRESGITAGLALGTPLLFGCIAAIGLLVWRSGWIGAAAAPWQFVLGVGMACAVTALPILMLLMEKLQILRAAARPAHPALRQPGRRGDLGRAGADPGRLAARRPAGRLPAAVRAGRLPVPSPDALAARSGPLVRRA